MLHRHFNPAYTNAKGKQFPAGWDIWHEETRTHRFDDVYHWHTGEGNPDFKMEVKGAVDINAEVAAVLDSLTWEPTFEPPVETATMKDWRAMDAQWKKALKAA